MTQLRGVGDTEWKSGGVAGLPVIFETAIEVGAPEAEDGVGAIDGPEQAELFEAMADDGLAAGLNDTGAYKQMLLRKAGWFMREALAAKCRESTSFAILP